MQHQYPFTCLTITVDGAFVDVNVHPTKMDVRFSDERLIMRAVSDCIRKTLCDQEMIIRQSLNPPAKPSGQREKKYRNPEPFERQMIRQKAQEQEMLREKAAPYGSSSGTSAACGSASGTAASYGASSGTAVPYGASSGPAAPYGSHSGTESGLSAPVTYDIGGAGFSDGKAVSSERVNTPSDRDSISHESEKTAMSSGTDPFRRPEKNTEIYEQQTLPGFLDIAAKPNRRIIGCAFKTYWIVEYGDKLFMIDQHAAHEKVLYTRFMKEYESSSVSSQQIDPPIVVSLDMDEQALYEEYRDAFSRAGFDIEPFGGREYKISAVPYHMSALGSKRLFSEMLDHLEVSSDPKKLEIYVHRVATEACKAVGKLYLTLASDYVEENVARAV
jgi:DNA mismatch repair protein MutL